MFLKKHYPWIFTFFFIAFAFKWHSLIIDGVDDSLSLSTEIHSNLQDLKIESEYFECADAYHSMENFVFADMKLGKAIINSLYILLSAFLLLSLSIPLIIYSDRKMRI